MKKWLLALVALSTSALAGPPIFWNGTTTKFAPSIDQVLFPTGTSAAPAMAPSGATGVGIWFPSSQSTAIGASGQSVLAVTGSSVFLPRVPQVGNLVLNSNGAIDSVAFANAAGQAVGSTGATGTSTMSARVDHAHQGVHSINVAGSPALYGDMAIAAGSNVTVSQSGTTITLAATGSSASSGVVPTASYEISNVGLLATVSGNALTIRLKNKDGLDPSSGSSVLIGFRDSTSTIGTYNQRAVTAGLSVVVSSGSTLGHASATDDRVHVYAIDNAGTIELAVSGSRSFDEGSLMSTTAEGGAGAADTRTVLYSTTARTNVAGRYLGWIGSNQIVAGTYATTPGQISLYPSERGLQTVAMFQVNGGNGFGATATKIRNFANTISTASGIFKDLSDANNGCKVQILEDGIYWMRYVDRRETNAASDMGISLNASASDITINITNIADASKLAFAQNSSFYFKPVSSIRRLKPGDIVRPHGDGLEDATSTNALFEIVQLIRF